MFPVLNGFGLALGIVSPFGPLNNWFCFLFSVAIVLCALPGGSFYPLQGRFFPR